MGLGNDKGTYWAAVLLTDSDRLTTHVTRRSGNTQLKQRAQLQAITSSSVIVSVEFDRKTF